MRLSGFEREVARIQHALVEGTRCVRCGKATGQLVLATSHGLVDETVTPATHCDCPPSLEQPNGGIAYQGPLVDDASDDHDAEVMQ